MKYSTTLTVLLAAAATSLVSAAPTSNAEISAREEERFGPRKAEDVEAQNPTVRTMYLSHRVLRCTNCLWGSPFMQCHDGTWGKTMLCFAGGVYDKRDLSGEGEEPEFDINSLDLFEEEKAEIEASLNDAEQ